MDDKVKKLIEAAKSAVQNWRNPAIDTLIDSLAAVESAKPGNRLELVEIMPGEEHGWHYFDQSTGRKYRLAHPAEMSEPMVPLSEVADMLSLRKQDKKNAAIIEWTKRGLIQWEKESEEWYRGKICGMNYFTVSRGSIIFPAILAQLAAKTPAEARRIEAERLAKGGVK